MAALSVMEILPKNRVVSYGLAQMFACGVLGKLDSKKLDLTIL